MFKKKQHNDLCNEWVTENVLLQQSVLIKECLCIIYRPMKMLFLAGVNIAEMTGVCTKKTTTHRP